MLMGVFRGVVRLAVASAWFFLGLLCVACGGPGPSYAEESAADPVNDAQPLGALSAAYVKGFAEEARLKEHIAFREKATHRFEAAMSAPGKAVFAALQEMDEATRSRLSDLLRDHADEACRALTESAERLAAQREQLQRAWEEVRTDVDSKQMTLFQVQATRQMAGQLAFLLNVDNRWFWLFGLLAIVGLLAAAAHERRHEIRRRLSGSRARAMGLTRILLVLLVVFAGITVALFVFGNRLYDSLLRLGTGAASPRQQMVRENEELQREVLPALRDKRQAADESYRHVVADWKQRMSAGGQGDARLLEQTQEVFEQVGNLCVDLAVQKKLAEEVDRDLKRLEEVEGQISSIQTEIDANLRKRGLIRGGLGLVLLGLVFGATVMFWAGIRRRQDETRNTCPLCLGHNTFSLNGYGGAAAGEGRGTIHCTNMIPVGQDDGQGATEECGFTFSAACRDMIRLCFPTLGVPSAGKTHWLAMAYHGLSQGRHPREVTFAHMRSPRSDELDQIVAEILDRHVGPLATQVTRIPDPVVFNVCDHDRVGKSNFLVNIFDYSGEVALSQTLADPQRRRALEGDGFFFFLDPTQPSHHQSRALAKFRQDLFEIKDVKVGRKILTPVALCVPKIDLMMNQRYADSDGGGAVGDFFEEIQRIGWKLNLRDIEARSRLMAEMREVIWPGWEIERQIDELFGGRYMYFPLTPVGFGGEDGLSGAAISPIGVLEPMLWLLHMNGYPVL